MLGLVLVFKTSRCTFSPHAEHAHEHGTALHVAACPSVADWGDSVSESFSHFLIHTGIISVEKITPEN